MSEVAIRAKNISKVYKLYANPLDRLKESVHPFRKKYHKDFYALHNISFEVRKGETVGIIGKNGSGKSTLLKILTGVLTPTEGDIITQGKISALLELGTGFNPELTGIENVYFSGTIMGYSREQIDEKLDDILSFADIGEFAYQPVKTYSSGMFVRLAFAVATSVDPDILIVDEALAVGDMRFHQKCIRRMESFRENNKTIFFVTHDVGMVNRFCTTALWLNDGIIQDLGISEQITKRYQSFMVYGPEMTQQARLSNPDIDNSVDLIEHSRIEWVDVGHCDSFGEGGARITHVAFYNAMTGEKSVILRGGEKVRFAVKIKCHASLTLPGLGLALKDPLGYIVFTINNYIYNIAIESFNPDEEYEFFISFNFPNIKNGRYIFVVAVSDGTQRNHIQHHWIHDSLEIVVQNDEEPYLLNALLILDKNTIQIESKCIN